MAAEPPGRVSLRLKADGEKGRRGDGENGRASVMAPPVSPSLGLPVLFHLGTGSYSSRLEERALSNSEAERRMASVCGV